MISRIPLTLRLLALVCLSCLISVWAKEEVVPEHLFRQTAGEWQSTGSYQSWHDFSTELMERYAASSTSQQRLEWVGALEESILLIEKATIHQGEDRKRDVALSNLYANYGKILFSLSDDDCWALVMDPHTLLLGVETARKIQVKNNHICVENAENNFRNAISLDATNDSATQQLEKLLGSDGSAIPDRKPKEFVAELFDSFADHFDQKLVGDLQYKVPSMIGTTVESIRPSYRNALDAGCGTGLAGRYLRPLVQDSMVGVDASSKMIDIAEKCTLTTGCGISKEDETKKGSSKPLYDRLLVMDLEDMTVENTLGSGKGTGFDLIVAADVHVYFGNLRNVMTTYAKISTPGAVLVFSCERATPDEAPLGWRLLASGRFAHTKEHVVEVANSLGYSLVSYEEIVPRMEKGEPVKGHMFGFMLKNEEDKRGGGEL